MPGSSAGTIRVVQVVQVVSARESSELLPVLRYLSKLGAGRLGNWD